MPTLLTERVFHPRGAASELIFDCQAPEVVLVGPAGTGKTRGCLEYVHKGLLEYAGARALILRKTLTSLVASALVTFQDKVLDPRDGVSFFGGSRLEPASFRYPNGSRLVVGGMDKASKVMSTEYDRIYVPEATELLEAEWESLTTRLRNGVMPYQQLLGDCNPDVPNHWLKRRGDSGRTVMLESRHRDNPTVTQAYMDVLDRLSGARKLRLRDGIWAASEGLVYETWDRSIHLISEAQLARVTIREVLAAVDWGYTNPGVLQVWGLDSDKRLYRLREIYRTQKTIDWWIARGLEFKRTYGVRLFVCDPSEPAYIQQFNSAGLAAVEGYNRVAPGIQAVQQRLQPAGDGRPRLALVRDALVERDEALVDKALPTCVEEEIDGYVWDLSAGRKKGEEPVKANDHGLDALRYLVAHVDLQPGRPFNAAVGGQRMPAVAPLPGSRR